MADPLSIREQVVLAVLARLLPLPGLTVERNRRSAAGDLAQPLLNLMEMGHTVEAVESSDSVYSLQLLLDMTVPAATDDGLGPALNALYARVLTALLTDPATGQPDFTLGGLCTDLKERGFDVRVLAAAESSAPLAECSLDLLAEYRTLDGNPYSL